MQPGGTIDEGKIDVAAGKLPGIELERIQGSAQQEANLGPDLSDLRHQFGWHFELGLLVRLRLWLRFGRRDWGRA